jgi:hypothetical protein
MSVNADRPNGFTPIGTMSGSPWSGYVRVYETDASEGTGIFVGDAVTLETDGNIAPAAAGEAILGVCVGVLPHSMTKINGQYNGNFMSSTSPVLHPSFSAASTADVILVCVGTDVIYEVQEDGVTDPIALIDVGENVDLVATHAGSTTTGRSGQEIDSDSHTTASAQFRLVSIVDKPDVQQGDVDTTLPNARWVVRVNENHLTLTDMAVTTGSVGSVGI